jgi:hypothetical protein
MASGTPCTGAWGDEKRRTSDTPPRTGAWGDEKRRTSDTPPRTGAWGDEKRRTSDTPPRTGALGDGGVELVGVKLALDLRTMGGERLALRTVLRLRDVRGLYIGLNQVDDIFGILGQGMTFRLSNGEAVVVGAFMT